MNSYLYDIWFLAIINLQYYHKKVFLQYESIMKKHFLQKILYDSVENQGDNSVTGIYFSCVILGSVILLFIFDMGLLFFQVACQILIRPKMIYHWFPFWFWNSRWIYNNYGVKPGFVFVRICDYFHERHPQKQTNKWINLVKL